MSAHEDTHAHDDHGHHHKETFVTKYIFSQDHKMIAKTVPYYRYYNGSYRDINVYDLKYTISMARRTKCSISSTMR